jgi:hypothetical protein
MNLIILLKVAIFDWSQADLEDTTKSVILLFNSYKKQFERLLTNNSRKLSYTILAQNHCRFL